MSENSNYQLTFDHQGDQTNAKAWLKLGVASLILAGLFSILLVFSRTPGVQDMIPFADFFHTALVVHVDLSVLIWFVSFAGVLWSLTSQGQKNWLDQAAIALAVSGTLVICISPFLGAGNPLMNNYIPVLDHPLFLTGLGLFTLGMLLQIIRRLSAGTPSFMPQTGADALNLGVYLSAWVALFSLLALVTSYIDIGDQLSGQSYYEALFWGGGHVLQFTHTLLLLVAWLWIAKASGVEFKFKAPLAGGLLLLVVLPVLVTPWIYWQHNAVGGEHRLAFTELMRFGGLASTPIGLLIVMAILGSGPCLADRKPVKAALLSSILLFAAGGVIGFMIKGVNVVIPAHYHGSIVGVTLAFMGLAYVLLPLFGYTKPTSKMAHWQPYVYGGGQLMHIIGLAWSGGYGVARKTAGAAQGLDRLPEIAGMGLMGLGGGISIIGGVLFLIVMIKAFLHKPVA